MDILMSIHDKWFRLIQSGEKKIEVRNSFTRDWKDIDWVYLYVTKPTGRILGRFRIQDVKTGTPEYLYSCYGNMTMINGKDYVFYTSYKKQTNFIFIKDYQDIDKELKDFNVRIPPVSWYKLKSTPEIKEQEEGMTKFTILRNLIEIKSFFNEFITPDYICEFNSRSIFFSVPKVFSILIIDKVLSYFINGLVNSKVDMNLFKKRIKAINQ